MNYFLTETERRKGHGSCFFEFQRGKDNGTLWLDDSLCLHADTFDTLDLYDLFSTAMPHFAYYGITVVTQKDWEALLLLSHEYGGIREEVIYELIPWVEEAFKIENTFRIYGI